VAAAVVVVQAKAAIAQATVEAAAPMAAAVAAAVNQALALGTGGTGGQGVIVIHYGAGIFLVSGPSWTVPAIGIHRTTRLKRSDPVATEPAALQARVGAAAAAAAVKYRKIVNATLTPGTTINIQIGLGGGNSTWLKTMQAP